MRSAAVLLLLTGCGLDWTLAPGDEGEHGGTSGGHGGATSTATGSAGADGGSGAGTSTTTGTTTTTTTTTSTTSTTTSPPMCDQGDCNACVQCSIGSGGACESLQQICIANPECATIDSCSGQCADGDTICYDNCYFAHPDGQSDWDAVDVCLFCGSVCQATCGAPPFWCP